MQDCKLIDTPIARGKSLDEIMCPKTPQEKDQMVIAPYSSAEGSDMYETICRRPDICYGFGLVR